MEPSEVESSSPQALKPTHPLSQKVMMPSLASQASMSLRRVTCMVEGRDWSHPGDGVYVSLRRFLRRFLRGFVHHGGEGGQGGRAVGLSVAWWGLVLHGL